MSQAWLEVLGAVYSKVPVRYRPAIKRTVMAGTLRGQAIARRRRIHRGRRVEFLDFEIAWLEPYAFLSPGPGEVRVESWFSTVSPGTERAVLCGLPGARRRFPYQPGYSLAGRAVEVARNVRGIREGDVVAGRVKHVSHDTVGSSLLFRVPEGVSAEEASFLELGIITLQGIRKAAIRPGESVAVVGQGLIGQLANKLARTVGAAEVVAVAASANRRKTAVGPDAAHRYLALKEDPDGPARLQADVVIEAVGTPQAIELSLRCARPGGRVILLGSSRGLGRNVDFWNLVQRRSVEIVGAHISAMPEREGSRGLWTYRREGELFLRLLAGGRLRVSDLVTWRPAPDDCNRVYEVIAAGGAEHVAIVFQWQGDEPGGPAASSEVPVTRERA